MHESLVSPAVVPLRLASVSLPASLGLAGTLAPPVCFGCLASVPVDGPVALLPSSHLLQMLLDCFAPVSKLRLGSDY